MSSNDIAFELDAQPVDAGTPLRYRTHHLVRIDSNVRRLAPTAKHALLSLLLPVVGAVCLVAGGSGLIAKFYVQASMALAVGGLMAASLGSVLCWARLGSVTFDLRRGDYWTNHRFDGPQLFGRFRGRVDNIAALQLVRGMRVTGARRFFPFYQLNLVLADPSGERVSLVTHGVTDAARADAEALTEFLRKPMVDQTGRQATVTLGADAFDRLFGPQADRSPQHAAAPDFGPLPIPPEDLSWVLDLERNMWRINRAGE